MILRAYIAAARNERYDATGYSVDMLKADVEGEPAMSILRWDVPYKIGKIIYDVLGHSSDAQFELGIVEQPGYLENAIICSQLRKTFGEISNVEGFDANGVFKRIRNHDYIVAVKENGLIARLETHSSRELEKIVKA